MGDILDYFLNNYWAATWLMLGAIAVAAICSANVKATFSKYGKVRSSRGIPANMVARQILDGNGLQNVNVVRVRGNLTDHYDPRQNVVALSDSVYDSTAVSAIGVAAHECGHAVQHAKSYVPVKIRTALVPILNIANRTWMFLVIIGIFIPYMPFLIDVGIIFFAIAAIFQLVTLPVEFNASSRALRTIADYNILDPNEQIGARKTLTAAALTYVAALLVSITQLIRILAIANRRR